MADTASTNEQPRPDGRGAPQDGLPADGPEGPGGPGHAEGEALQERRRAAWRAARRTLTRGVREPTVGERLAELAEAAETFGARDAVDLYGDGVVARLEERVAGLLGMPAAAFFPTGTMAQQVALRCWAARTGNPVVALHPLAHPEVHEEGALGAVSGLRTVHPTSEPRLPTADEVREFGEPFGTLMLELPLRDAGFVLPEWDELTALVEAARERDAVVHLDGARLWESVTHFGRELHEIASLADSVYVSFYKSLRGLSGAVLAGPAELVAEARSWRHRYGGNLFQQFPAALSALWGLERELPRLPAFVAKARTVAGAIADALDASPHAPWSRVHPRPPHTHQFQVWLGYDADVLNETAIRQAEETGVALFRVWTPSPAGPPGLAVTEVTVDEPALEWSEEDVRAATAEFLRRAAERAAGA